MIGTKVDHDCITCDKPCDQFTVIETTAASMNSGDSAVIWHLKADDGATVKILVSMGFAPGHTIMLDSIENGSRLFSVDGSTVAIDDRLAQSVCIE